MAGDDKPKIAINGNSSGYDPTLQDNITMALKQNGGAGRVQTIMQQRLDECGWTQNLRDHVEQSFRAGDVTTFEEAMRSITQHARLAAAGDDSGNLANGTANGEAPSLTIPLDVAKDVAEVLRKEIAKVVKLDK